MFPGSTFGTIVFPFAEVAINLSVFALLMPVVYLCYLPALRLDGRGPLSVSCTALPIISLDAGLCVVLKWL